MIQKETINFFSPLYPVGGHYILTSIRILDGADASKELLMNRNHISGLENSFTKEEIQLLKSMSQPEIHYIYGIDQMTQNTFASMIEKEGDYTSLLPAEMKEAITAGLGLESDVSIEEIYAAIKNKEYSETPLKDAGLSLRIKFMDEKEFFETIASLDSLVCNLAATLAVEVNDELVYTEGYLNVDDEYIMTSEAHGWAMKEDGSIIEVTPSSTEVMTEEEQNAISKIILWCIKHDIPKYALIAFICRVMYRIFGKQFILTARIRRVKKLLSTPGIEQSYAKVTETLYGGVNVPCAVKPSELVLKLEEELSSLSKEELKDLKKEIKLTQPQDEEAKNAQRLINEIPFIRKNSKQLQKVLKKDPYKK